MGFHSSPVVRFSVRARVRFLQPDSRTDTPVSVGCVSADRRKNSLLHLPPEMKDFVLRQKPPFAGPEFFILQEADPYTAELLDGMTDGLKHPADLLVPALM